MFTKYVQWRLEHYVKKYFKKYHPVLIVVVGSVGKTTTKNAIAMALSKKYRIQLETGNLNTAISVPLAIMGVKYPPMELVRKVKTWRQVFKAMKERVKSPQGVDVIIQELATDRPGDLAVFKRYLKPDIAVVTAVAPEHMENFIGGLEQVAKEELSVASFSDLTIVNADDIDSRFADFADTNNITNYGINAGEYQLKIIGGNPLAGYDVVFHGPEINDDSATTKLHVMGEHMLRSTCAAVAVGLRLGVPIPELMENLSAIRPVKGRMNPLSGLKGSTLIDDTYNSSPEAAVAALKTLYQIEAPQRIAILGTMNELGNYTSQGHQQVGSNCDPMKLDWVITIGQVAEQWLAPAARQAGCQVKSFPDPISAATFCDKVLRTGGVVLIKGSQNEVFAEEATKRLLSNAFDSDQLVRQDDYWGKRKRAWLNSIDFKVDGE